MDDFIQGLWEQFEIESEEHLDLIEPLLAGAGRQGVDGAGIAQLFRSFHSLKGLAGAMAMTGMQGVAHRAEDLLGLVRAGETPLSPPLVALLLEALDLLGELRQRAITDHQDAPPPTELLARLARAFDDARAAPAAAPAPTASWRPDPEMVSFFTELLGDKTPLLAGLLAPAFANDPERQEEVAITLGTLQHAASVMARTDLAALLDRFTRQREDATATPATWAGLCQELLAVLGGIEADSGKPAGRTALEHALRAVIQEHHPELLPQLFPAAAEETSAAEAPAVAREPSAPEREKSAEVIRVNSETLDQFMNLIGELVLVRGQLTYALHDEEMQTGLVMFQELVEQWREEGRLPVQEQERVASLLEVIKAQQVRLSRADAQFHGALGRLREKVMALRVVPIDTVFKRFPRVMRELAAKMGKQARLEMSGQEVRIDKGMVDALVDPLMHMVRNSVDHGLESAEERQVAGKPVQGVVAMMASQRGNRVVVAVRDDGRGLDPQKIRAKAVEQGLVAEAESLRLSREELFQFIFRAGFSTADKVTETSGRGVGMDVVRTMVTRLGGDLRIHSEPGEGSTVTLELPLSAAIQNTLIVEVGGQFMAIPDRHVAEILEVRSSELQAVKGRVAMVLRKAFLPLEHLGELLGYQAAPVASGEALQVLILSQGKGRVGVVVDRLSHREELFVKEIHPHLAALPGVGSASIRGDGRVILILDGEDLFRLAERPGEFLRKAYLQGSPGWGTAA